MTRQVAGFTAIGIALAVGCALTIPKLRQPAPFVPFYDFRSPSNSWTLVVFVPSGRDAGYAESIASTVRDLRERAEASGAAFSTVGVAMDWVVADGVELLRYYSTFDEIIVGRNWLNTAAAAYIWRDHPGPRAVPQVVLLTNRVEPVGRTDLRYGPPVVLARVVGASALRQWVKSGYPTMREPPSAAPFPDSSHE